MVHYQSMMKGGVIVLVSFKHKQVFSISEETFWSHLDFALFRNRLRPHNIWKEGSLSCLFFKTQTWAHLLNEIKQTIHKSFILKHIAILHVLNQ